MKREFETWLSNGLAELMDAVPVGHPGGVDSDSSTHARAARSPVRTALSPGFLAVGMLVVFGLIVVNLTFWSPASVPGSTPTALPSGGLSKDQSVALARPHAPIVDRPAVAIAASAEALSATAPWMPSAANLDPKRPVWVVRFEGETLVDCAIPADTTSSCILAQVQVVVLDYYSGEFIGSYAVLQPAESGSPREMPLPGGVSLDRAVEMAISHAGSSPRSAVYAGVGRLVDVYYPLTPDSLDTPHRLVWEVVFVNGQQGCGIRRQVPSSAYPSPCGTYDRLLTTTVTVDFYSGDFIGTWTMGPSM